MNFFNLNAPYKCAATSASEKVDYAAMIDFQFTSGNQACECIASTSVYNHLCSAKQTIETCDPDDWDEMKKVTNPYEYIHTAVPGHKYPVSKFKPLSRSFYKMIEIIKQCKLLPAYRMPLTINANAEDYHPPYYKYYKYGSSYGRGGCGYNKRYYHNHQHYPTPGNGFYKHCHNSTEETDTDESETKISVQEQRQGPEHGPIIQSFHLAEGPGGFIEALCYLRANPNDTYYGMTLVDDAPNSACPGWKKSRLFLEKNPCVKLEYGKDGTGNLLSLDNYLHCCEKYRHSMDVITADGGFDFSSNFNHQEVLAQTLVVSEVLYALSLQKPGGTFVLKIFDTFTRVTVDIIHLLALFYSDVIIIKPNTSRVANSEKYIVCKGFKLVQDGSEAQLISVFRTFFEKLALTTTTTKGSGIGAILRSCDYHKLHIIHRIEEVNAILGQQQIENIISTVALVHGKPADRVDVYKKAHIQKCVDWCERYNIPYNKHSITTNTFINMNMNMNMNANPEKN
jgi:23S rRNA U2552 (ribose-2'-O)-methylase RlmE/FtsJ